MKKTLTEIADDIYAENAGYISKRNIHKIVNSCFGSIARELINGHNVMVTNFGKFKPTQHSKYPSASFAPADKLKQEIRENRKSEEV
jgi:nucleoid DNA-binding protein